MLCQSPRPTKVRPTFPLLRRTKSRVLRMPSFSTVSITIHFSRPNAPVFRTMRCVSSSFLIDIQNLTFVTAVVLGKQWKSEAQPVKDFYFQAALRLKEQHQKDHPNYAYQPRKSAEKKRRMTARKVRKLNAIAGSLVGAAVRDSEGPVNEVPSFQLTPNGDLNFTLGDATIPTSVFTEMLEKTDLSNLLSYASAYANFSGSSEAHTVKRYLEEGGYEKNAVNVSEAFSNHSIHPVDRPIHGVKMRDVKYLDPKERNRIDSSVCDAGKFNDTQLFLKNAYDEETTIARLDEMELEIQKFVADASDDLVVPTDEALYKAQANKYDIHSQKQRLEDKFSSYVRN